MIYVSDLCAVRVIACRCVSLIQFKYNQVILLLTFTMGGNHLVAEKDDV